MFEGFKKTVMFYKSVAFYHLITTYIFNMVAIDYISLAMIGLGFGVSGWAAAAIGIDQTYFGAELGRIKPNRITTFPYNVTNHPMIMGNIVGLLGFHKLEGFREEVPWLVPMHILLYTIHMVQVLGY
jgi:Phospholipid methyltransferase